VEQAHTELRLEPRQALAHCGRCHVEPLGRSRQAAAVGGFDKGKQALQLFHRRLLTGIHRTINHQ
jgi:hypothetical protein